MIFSSASLVWEQVSESSLKIEGVCPARSGENHHSFLARVTTLLYSKRWTLVTTPLPAQTRHFKVVNPRNFEDDTSGRDDTPPQGDTVGVGFDVSVGVCLDLCVGLGIDLVWVNPANQITTYIVFPFLSLTDKSLQQMISDVRNCVRSVVS